MQRGNTEPVAVAITIEVSAYVASPEKERL